MVWEIEVSADGEIVCIDGEKVTKVVRIGYGAQHTVLLVGTEVGKYYIVESGASVEGQYARVLSELNEIENIFLNTDDVECPKCGSYDWDKVDEEHAIDGNVTIIAKCNDCGARFKYSITVATIPLGSIRLED